MVVASATPSGFDEDLALIVARRGHARQRCETRHVALVCTAVAATLAGAAVWLGFYAAGDDSYYGPNETSRWEHGTRFVGASALIAAAVIVVASVVALLVAARSPKLRRWVAPPAAVIGVVALLCAWLGRSTGH